MYEANVRYGQIINVKHIFHTRGNSLLLALAYVPYEGKQILSFLTQKI